jgi:hypothetical protein
MKKKINELREITEKIIGAAHNNSTVTCADGNIRVLHFYIFYFLYSI